MFHVKPFDIILYISDYGELVKVAVELVSPKIDSCYKLLMMPNQAMTKIASMTQKDDKPIESNHRNHCNSFILKLMIWNIRCHTTCFLTVHERSTKSWPGPCSLMTTEISSLNTPTYRLPRWKNPYSRSILTLFWMKKILPFDRRSTEIWPYITLVMVQFIVFGKNLHGASIVIQEEHASWIFQTNSLVLPN